MTAYLTKKWQTRKLKPNFYYIRIDSGMIILQWFDGISFYMGQPFPDNSIVEVLAEVPSYQEFMALKRKVKLKK